MTSSLIHVGLVQFDIAWERPGENMQRIETLLGQTEGLDLVILPEMWSTGFSMRPESVAESAPGQALSWMMTQANQRNAAITGSISVAEGNRFFNRWYCAYPDGRTTQYDKKHLFSFGKEDLHYTAGHHNIQIEIKGWKIRPVICYDLRFPVWCRNTDDYDMLMVVANWPVARIHHWDALLRARAIENQAFVTAVNRIGTDGNNLNYNGHSAIYDMNGSSVLSPGEEEGVLTAVLDKADLTSFRQQFRFLQDRDHFIL